VEHSRGELEPRGRVERQHAPSGAPADQLDGLSGRLAPLAVAEQGVDDELGLARRHAWLMDGDPEPPGDGQLLGRYRREPFVGRREGHRDLGAGYGQVPCRDEAPAAVPSGPGKHQDRASRRVAAEEVTRHRCQAAARVLHHPHERDAELLDHDPVDVAHLVDRQPRHRPWIDRRKRLAAARPVAHPVGPSDHSDHLLALLRWS
jgi:hypothetical protein